MGKALALQQLHEWAEYATKEKGRSKRTVHGYVTTYVEFLDFLQDRHQGEDVDWRHATLEDQRAYVLRPTLLARADKPAGSPPSEGTKHVRAAMLRTLFKFLHQRGYLSSNPSLALETPKVDNERPRPIGIDHWRSIYRVLLDGGVNPEDPEGRDADLVGLGLGVFCGLRAHEITNLRSSHFMLLEGELQLSGFKRKGQAKAKWPIPWYDLARMWEEYLPEMIGGDHRTFTEPLMRLIRDSRDKPFLMDPWRARQLPTGRKRKFKYPDGYVTPKLVWQRLRAAAGVAGVHHEDVGPHMLRHRFGSSIANTVPDDVVSLLELSRLMGHTDVRVTQRYIEHVSNPLKGRLGREQPSVDLSMFAPA